MLQTRKSRREEPDAVLVADDIAGCADGPHPEEEAVLADSVGSALLDVLDTLAPAERLAFVLHDMFAVTFEEIAPIAGRSPAAARQLASRARRRVQGADTSQGTERVRQREIVAAFLAASRNGHLEMPARMRMPDLVSFHLVRPGSASAAESLVEHVADADGRSRTLVQGTRNRVRGNSPTFFPESQPRAPDRLMLRNVVD